MRSSSVRLAVCLSFLFDWEQQVFSVEVEVGQTGKGWALEKRFSDFDKLHNQLQKMFSRERPNLPKLPPSRTRVTNKKALDYRRLQLENYLRVLLKPTQVCACTYVSIRLRALACVRLGVGCVTTLCEG